MRLHSGLALFQIESCLLSFFLLVIFLSQSHASSHKDHHLHLHQLGERGTTGIVVSRNNTSENSTATNAESLVQNALKALAVMNKGRLEHAQLNKYEFQNASTIKEAAIPAPPLDYTDVISNSSSSATKLRRNTNGTTTGNATNNFAYTIPSELAEAAKILAESTPPTPSTGNHSLVAAQIQEKYRLRVNDTNMPPQVHRRSNGLAGYVPAEVSMETIVTSNETVNSIMAKRATSTFWMETMTQTGASPFAPSDYKVFGH
jgi:hypothetical protein